MVPWWALLIVVSKLIHQIITQEMKVRNLNSVRSDLPGQDAGSLVLLE
jgi:hypothetical protein